MKTIHNNVYQENAWMKSTKYIKLGNPTSGTQFIESTWHIRHVGFAIYQWFHQERQERSRQPDTQAYPYVAPGCSTFSRDPSGTCLDVLSICSRAIWMPCWINYRMNHPYQCTANSGAPALTVSLRSSPMPEIIASYDAQNRTQMRAFWLAAEEHLSWIL